MKVDGQPCLIRNQKARELLAYLASSKNETVRKTVLSEALWPDAPLANAKESLYKVLRFCKTTEPLKTYLPLETSRNMVRLNAENVDCDIHQFEQYCRRPDDIQGLIQAVELYRGPFLFNEYYEWTVEKEAYYEIRFMEIVEKLVTYFTGQNQPSRAYYYKKKLDMNT